MTDTPTSHLRVSVIDVVAIALVLTGAVFDAIVAVSGGPAGDGPRYRLAVGATSVLHLACAAACFLRASRPRLFTAASVILLGLYVVVQLTAPQWLGFPFLMLMAPLAVATMAHREDDRRVARSVLALACAACLVTPAAFGPGDKLTSVVVSVLVILLAWLTGLQARLRDRAARDRRAAIARAAVADERERIALDLHDQVGHGLSAIAAQARAGVVLMDRDPARAREVLERIASVASETLDATRATVRGLRAGEGDLPAAHRTPVSLRPVDDPSAPARVVENLRAAGAEVRMTPDDPDELAALTAQWAPANRVALERVVQEGCTNALRHGRAGSPVAVTVRHDGEDGAVLEIVNSLKGPAPAAPDGPRASTASGATPGTGLIGLRTRLDAVGGKLEVSRDADLFRLWARIPSGSSGALLGKAIPR